MENTNRMTAKRIKGEHCRFCGDARVPLVKTPCCEKWICCDTDPISIRGGGYCQDEHERYSPCYFHYNEGHTGPQADCEQCRKELDLSESAEERWKRDGQHEKPRTVEEASFFRMLFN